MKNNEDEIMNLTLASTMIADLLYKLTVEMGLSPISVIGLIEISKLNFYTKIQQENLRNGGCQ